MKYASAISRALNFLIDILAISGITYLGIVVFVLRYEPDTNIYDFIFDRDSNLILNIYFYASLFLYYLLFESFTGKTLGKYVTGTKVVDMEGNKPDKGKILLRTIIRVVLIPIDWLSFFKSEPIGWHDSISKTAVVLK